MLFRANARFCAKVRASEIKVDPLGGNHNLLRLFVGKLKGPNDDLCFAFADNTFFVRIHENQLELILREWLMGDFPVTHAAQNPTRQLLERPMDWA
jgi:hypothetical protein